VSGHADAETLAAFREELLSRRKAGRVSAHLAVCPRCAALDAQLAEVTAMLASSTAPPMPDALTARIEAALATEATARRAAAAAPNGAAPVGAVPAGAASGGQGTALGAGERGRGAQGAAGGRRPRRTGPGRSWLALRVAAVTAAVAVVAGGGYGVAQLLSTGSPAATGGSSTGAGAPANRPRIAPRMPAVGLQPRMGASASGTSPAPARVIRSGTNYQPGQLGAQASAVLTGLSPNAHSSASPGPTKAAPQHRPGDILSPGLQDCVAHVSGQLRPLLVDLASYRGHPAAIIVLPAANSGAPRALVVPAGCTPATVHILAAATLPRSG
jgi:hypothetical protein